MTDTTPAAGLRGLPPGAADQAAAAHALINITEDLGRYLRIVSGGMLTLAVVHNTGATGFRAERMGWGDAHDAADRVSGTASRADVLATAAVILRGSAADAEVKAVLANPPGPPPDPDAGRSYWPEFTGPRCTACGLPYVRSDLSAPGSVVHVHGHDENDPATVLLNAYPHNVQL
jgi:hypothetical protein